MAATGELTQAQVDRLDVVDNLCHQLLCQLAGKDDLPWDIEHIGDLADMAEEIICDRLKLCSRMEFRPYVDLAIKRGVH